MLYVYVFFIVSNNHFRTIRYFCIILLVTCDHYTDTHPNYNKPRDPRIESDEVMPPRPHLRLSVNKH